MKTALLQTAILLSLSMPLFAVITGRYVRIENPTAPNMAWQEIEVIGKAEIGIDDESKNLLFGKPELFTGTGYVPDRPVSKHEAPRLVDGNKDTKQRGPDFRTGSSKSNPWIEIDLCEPMAIDEILLYGSRYPDRLYLDKGHRVVSILDSDRKVVWAVIFDYQNQKEYPKGIFAFKPQAMTGGLVGLHVPENSSGWVPMSIVLDVEPEKPPADAEVRMARFKERNSPENIKKLADKMFNLLEPIPELAEARKFYKAGNDQAALDAWKVYWFDKMKQRNMYAGFDAGHISYASQTEDLLNNLRVTISSHSIGTSKFTPGCINWVDLPEDPKKLTLALADTSFLALVNFFGRSLLDGYNKSGQEKYLQKWSEIMDDWCMNFFRDADASPYNVKDLFVMIPANHWCVLMEELSDIAERHPKFIEELPSPTLARIQLTCMDQYGPAYWRVCRKAVFNHTSSALGAWNRILPYIDEFKPGKRIAKEWRQHLARWMTQGVEPDGSMVEIGDEGHFSIPMFLGFAFNQLDKDKPDWYTPGFRNRAMEYFDNLYKYRFRHPATGGYDHRIGRRGFPYENFTDLTNAAYTRDKGSQSQEIFLDRSKELYAEPEMRRILDAVCDISAGRVEIDPKIPWQEKHVLQNKQRAYDAAKKILGEDKPGPPKINSDWMPYTGSYYFRGGWGKNDPFMAMLAPGSKGGSQPDMFNWAYGALYAYDYNFPLSGMHGLSIDNSHYNPLFPDQVYMPGSKNHSLTYAQRTPSPFRWHASANFDYGEAIYQGAYQNLPVNYVRNSHHDVDFQQPVIKDVQTVRRVIFLRKQRIFVSVDAVQYQNTDTQAQLHYYKIPLTMMQTDPLKHPARDDNAKLVTTTNSTTPNGTIRQFADFPVNYKMGHKGKPDDSYANRIGGNITVIPQEITASWQVAGDFAMSSLISSADTGEQDLVASTQALNQGREISGFSASLKDGTQIWLKTTVNGAKQLDCDIFNAIAQTVVVIKDKSGGVSGLALGCKKLTVDGKAIHSQTADFEFVGSEVTKNIYKPISPVTFDPDVNAFTDTLTVKMQSKTPDVEIRYTTDGTRPNRNSKLYTGPITITESTEFAARAYREGYGETPSGDFDINGTLFTVPSYGWFYKKPFQPPVKINEKLEPGLNFEFIQAPWTELFTRAHWMKPQAVGTANRELDLSKINCPDAHAVLYKGYIDIPTDGVYTFHAPREYVYMNNATSYDLRLYIDGEEWDLTQWWHGLGTWSIPLKKGLHRFELDFVDARVYPYRKSGLWRWYPTPWVIYQGDPSPIMISGPGLNKQRIPEGWFRREPLSTRLPVLTKTYKETEKMKKTIAIAAMATALTVQGADVTELTLNTTSAPAEQGWEKVGGLEAQISEEGIVIDDQSTEDSLGFKQTIPAGLEAAIQKNGFELTVNLKIGETKSSNIEVDVAGVRILGSLYFGNRRQSITYWDPIEKKHMGASRQNEDFNTWKIVWKPTETGYGTVEIFVGDEKLAGPVNCAKSRSKTPYIAIGSLLPHGKTRTGKITVKSLSLKAGTPDTP